MTSLELWYRIIQLAKDAREEADTQEGRFPLELSLAEMEERQVRRVVRNARTMQEAADTLGITKRTLWEKRKRYDMPIRDKSK